MGVAAVSKYRALDFMKIDAMLAETAAIKDELKREIEKAVEGRGGAAARARRGKRTG
jgi:NTE family protein